MFFQNNKSIIIIDTETSGTTLGSSSIIQLGAKKIDKLGNIEKEGFNIYIKPYTFEWNTISQNVHGITQEYLNKYGVGLDVFCREFEDWVGAKPDSYILAQWSDGFDTSMLKYAYQFSGRNYPFDYKSYDISSIARFYLTSIGQKCENLWRCSKALGVYDENVNNKEHDAYHDASITALILKELVKRMDGLISLDKNK
jgi:DNA polymerase III epsilon subunit-like protein